MSYSLQVITASSRTRTTSDEVLGGALCQRWHEVNPRVSLRRLPWNAEDPPAADVTLLHTTFDAISYRPAVLEKIRARCKVVIGWMEIMPREEQLRFFDRFFYYANPLPPPRNPAMIHLPPPYEPSDYPRWPKVGGRRRILLDHSVACYPNWHSPTWDWTDEIRQAVQPLTEKGWTIGQLNRGPQDPPWVEKVEQSEVREYLRRLVEYDCFVVTHAGSFNHSAKDARIMGLQVVYPLRDNTPFVPVTVAARLGMIQVREVEDLVEAVQQPPPSGPEVRGRCITVRETAERMDREIRFLLQAQENKDVF